MRLLIDIPEEVYNVCKGWQELNRSTRLENIVANGIPYEERKEEQNADKT